MAKTSQEFYRLMTPDVLYTKSVLRSDKLESTACTKTFMKLSETFDNDTLLFRIPLVNKDEIKSVEPAPTTDPPDFGWDPPWDLMDVTINLNVGMRYRELDPNEPYSAANSPRVTFMIAEQACDEGEPDPHGMGFQIRDPREFDAYGPYRGVEVLLEPFAAPPTPVAKTVDLNAKGTPYYLPDQRAEYRALEALGPEAEIRRLLPGDPRAVAAKLQPAPPRRREAKEIPERFEMTLKPNAWWGRCASSLLGGHSVSVAPFFNSLDVTGGLFLDVYARKPRKNYYEIKYVEVSIYR